MCKIYGRLNFKPMHATCLISLVEPTVEQFGKDLGLIKPSYHNQTFEINDKRGDQFFSENVTCDTPNIFTLDLADILNVRNLSTSLLSK